VTAAMVAVFSVVGLAVGWLLDPLVTRVPVREPATGPPDTVLSDDGPPDEAPVLSRSTGRQVAVAIVCGVLFGALAARFEDSWALPAYLVLAAALVALSVIDLELYILPNRIVYPLALAMVVLLTLAAVGDDDLDAIGRGLLAGVVAFTIFFVLHMISPRSMGFGDVKLAFVLGLSLGWLSWGEVLLGLFLGFFYGAVVGIVLIATRVRAKSQALPFGPFLAAGALTAVLVGDSIINWYRGS
jgi:leader peptidase (prepilin peptidase) / N-methyltransferase